MNQQDVFLVNMRELYASKLHKDPVWRVPGNSSPPELMPCKEHGSEPVSFVVDWQMESVEYHLTESGFSQTARTESYLTTGSFTHEQQDPVEKGTYTNIFDW